MPSVAMGEDHWLLEDIRTMRLYSRIAARRDADRTLVTQDEWDFLRWANKQAKLG